MFDVQPSYNLPTTLFNVLFPIISIVLCAGLFFVLPKKTAKTFTTLNLLPIGALKTQNKKYYLATPPVDIQTVDALTAFRLLT